MAPVMVRPLPTFARGARRARSNPPRIVLACPRVCPEWELGTLRALMKPHEFTRGAVEHRDARQRWPDDAATAIDAARRAVAERLGYSPALHLPDGGDYWLIGEVDEADLQHARALAAVLSRRLPGLWLTLGKLYVRDARFYRRERGFLLTLREASDVHLPRDVRSALRGVL